MLNRTDPASAGPLHGRTVLVTGGAGFLGAHVAQALAAAGLRVVLQDSAVKREDLLAPVLRQGHGSLVVGDLMRLPRLPALLAALEQADYVVHLGLYVPPAREPGRGTAQLVAGNLRLFEQLLAHLPATVKGVVLASTLEVYGTLADGPVSESHPLCGNSTLALAKLALEEALGAFGSRRGLPATILRFATLFGPGEYLAHRLIPRILRSLLVCQSPVIYGDGGDVHDYVFVKDAAQAVRLALERLADAPGAYNIATGHGWTTRAVAEIAQRLLRLSLPPKHMPASGPRQRLVGDGTRARERLGFQPATQLEAGLAAEIAYDREYLLREAESLWHGESRPPALAATPRAGSGA